MSFKGYAESSARGFRSFQLQLPTKEVLSRMREDSNRELGFKKDNLTAYKERNREYLNTLVSGQNATSKSLREAQTFRNENLRTVQKWEMKRWKDKVDKAKDEVTRIQQYGQQNPSPSTLESIAGLIGEYAPKIAGIIQEQKVAEAKAEKDFTMQLIGNTGLTTKHLNEIRANEEAIKAQTVQGIELQRRINAEIGLTGDNAITSEQFLRLSNITGENQLIRDQMLAYNAVQKYPNWLQSRYGEDLSQLFPGKGYGEGETLSHILNPNLGYDNQRAGDTLMLFRSLFMKDSEVGNPGDLPLGTQGQSMFASLRKTEEKILAEYGRGVNKVRDQELELQQTTEIQNAWSRTRQEGNSRALVDLRDYLAKKHSHRSGGGNTYANNAIYNWFDKAISLGHASDEDVRNYSRAMAARYPDKWVGKGWPEKFRHLAAKAVATRNQTWNIYENEKRIAAQEVVDNLPRLLEANPQVANMSEREFREFLVDLGLSDKDANPIVSRFVRKDGRIEIGSSVTEENGGLWQKLKRGLAEAIVGRHRDQNTSTILKPSDLTSTTASRSKQLMMARAENIARAAYDAEYSETRDHTRAEQYAFGVFEAELKKGEFDMSPNKHMVDGKEQQRTEAHEFDWINAPKGTTQISDAKSKVVTRLGQLQDTNPTPEEYINKVTSKGFIPPEVIQSSMTRSGATSLASFRGHPAVQAILRNPDKPKNLTSSYLYSKHLEALGYEPLGDDRVLDPDEYNKLLQDSRPTIERLNRMEAAPYYDERVYQQNLNTGREMKTNYSVTGNIQVSGQVMGKSEYIPQSGRLRGIYGNKHNISAEELSYAINTIMGEAGPDDDQYYVMAVILNRKAANPHLHIRDIVSAPKQFVGYKHGRQIDPVLLARFMSEEGMAKTYEAQLHLGNRTQFRGKELYPNMGDGDVRPNGASNYYFHSPQAAGKHVRYNPVWHSYSWQSIWSGPLQRGRKPDPTFGTGVPSNPEGYTITPPNKILGLI